MVQASFEPPASNGIERRDKPRLRCSYPARVRGQLAGGMRYEAQAVLSNLSSSGMYLRMKRPLQIGEAVFVIVRLSTAPLGEVNVPQIAAFAKTLRVEALPDGAYGVAVSLMQHRFM
jgi:hypothetical protein